VRTYLALIWHKCALMPLQKPPNLLMWCSHSGARAAMSLVSWQFLANEMDLCRRQCPASCIELAVGLAMFAMRHAGCWSSYSRICSNARTRALLQLVTRGSMPPGDTAATHAHWASFLSATREPHLGCNYCSGDHGFSVPYSVRGSSQSVAQHEICFVPPLPGAHSTKPHRQPISGRIGSCGHMGVWLRKARSPAALPMHDA
jgi:hypothetical protein